MKIAFVGKGRVSTALAKHFEKYGACVIGFHTRSNPNPDILKECDILFIATPDDQISSVAQSVSTSAQICCHFSGALCSDILQPIGNHITVASLHPAMTFAGPIDLTTVPFTFEGSGDKLCTFLSFLKECEIAPIQINQNDKPLYHAAMCNVSNHITSLIYMTVQMLKRLQIDDQAIYSLITPITKAAVENTLTITPEKALTGPISRGDIDTIKKQMPYVDETYKALSRKTVELAVNAGRIDENMAKDLLKEIGG